MNLKPLSIIAFCLFLLSCNRQRTSESRLLSNGQVRQEVASYLKRNEHAQNSICYLELSAKLGWTFLEMSSIIYDSELIDLKPCHYEYIDGRLVLIKDDCQSQHIIGPKDVRRISKIQLIDNIGPSYTINAAGDTILNERVFYDPEVLRIKLFMDKVVSVKYY